MIEEVEEDNWFGTNENLKSDLFKKRSIFEENFNILNFNIYIPNFYI